jgi:hypothetical protein
MIKIGPEALAQAEGLDFPVTELDELRPSFARLRRSFGNAVRSSKYTLIPAHGGI